MHSTPLSRFRMPAAAACVLFCSAAASDSALAAKAAYRATPPPFTDVAASDPSFRAIDGLRQERILWGYGDGTYRPSERMSRYDFLRATLGTFSVIPADGDGLCFVNDTAVAVDIRPENMFPDASGISFSTVCQMKKLGIIHGGPDGLFRPGDPINAAEASKILAIAFRVPLQERDGGEWYETYTDALSGMDGIKDLTADPAHALTRGEVARLLWHFYGKK